MKPLPDMTREELYHAAYQLKRMVKHLGRLIPASSDARFTRVAGGAICPECGLEYFDHPAIGEDLIFHVGCDGRLLKL